MSRPTWSVRWCVRADMLAVLDIERSASVLAFSRPWGEEDMLAILRDRNTIGMVAECGDRLGGYMVYRLGEDRFELLRLGVSPCYWRRGVGRTLVERLQSKCLPHRMESGALVQPRRRVVTALVHERNEVGWRFFQAMGFVARLARGLSENGDDAYAFSWLAQAIVTPEEVEEACQELMGEVA